MADISESDMLPQTNGLDNGLEEDDRMKMRPADIDADMREMERRKRVEMIMSSQLFREELERIIEVQMKDGHGPAGLLQQISDMMGVQGSRLQSTNFFRSSNCVVPINDIRGVESMGYAKGEKILRCRLAAVYRLMDLYGWTQSIYNHITARLNQDQEHFLVNPFGLLYHEITASSLVKVDMQGTVVEHGTTNFGVNVAGFQLHAAVHAARPDIKCVIHLHTPSVLAVSSLKCGLLPLSQESVVIGEVSLHPFHGSPYEPEEKEKIARNLGPNNKVVFLTNHGALCCGETIEEAFYNVYNTVHACETQMKLMTVGIDNLVVIPDETRKQVYEAARRCPEGTAPPPSILGDKKEKKFRIGGLEFEALMRMLDNAGFRTGYIYRQPLVKKEPPRPRNDVEVPPAVSSLGYLLEEEEMYKSGNWKKYVDGRKSQDRTRWLNSPNVYQKVEILETGTPDPKKITKWVDANADEWVAEASPTHSSTPVKIDAALQFVPKGTNPKEFKKLQQQIKENRRADKITSGPQSHILEGVSWEEAKKLQDANISATGDQVILVGAASKGIIQRGFQHNATVYKTPYAKNPFDAVTDQELEDYKKVVIRKQKGESSYDEDQSESEALSSSAALPPTGIKSPASETEEESRDEPQVLRIQTTQAPRPSQAEVVLSDEPESADSDLTPSFERSKSARYPVPTTSPEPVIQFNRTRSLGRDKGNSKDSFIQGVVMTQVKLPEQMAPPVVLNLPLGGEKSSSGFECSEEAEDNNDLTSYEIQMCPKANLGAKASFFNTECTSVPLIINLTPNKLKPLVNTHMKKNKQVLYIGGANKENQGFSNTISNILKPNVNSDFSSWQLNMTKLKKELIDKFNLLTKNKFNNDHIHNHFNQNSLFIRDTIPLYKSNDSGSYVGFENSLNIPIKGNDKSSSFLEQSLCHDVQPNDFNDVDSSKVNEMCTKKLYNRNRKILGEKNKDSCLKKDIFNKCVIRIFDINSNQSCDVNHRNTTFGIKNNLTDNETKNIYNEEVLLNSDIQIKHKIINVSRWVIERCTADLENIDEHDNMKMQKTSTPNTSVGGEFHKIQPNGPNLKDDDLNVNVNDIHLVTERYASNLKNIDREWDEKVSSFDADKYTNNVENINIDSDENVSNLVLEDCNICVDSDENIFSLNADECIINLDNNSDDINERDTSLNTDNYVIDFDSNRNIMAIENVNTLENEIYTVISNTTKNNTRLNTEINAIDLEDNNKADTNKTVARLETETITVDLANNQENRNDELYNIQETSLDKDYYNTLPYGTHLITDIIKADEIQTDRGNCTMKYITKLDSERPAVDIQNYNEDVNGNVNIEIKQTKMLETYVDKNFCILPSRTQLIPYVITVTDDEIQHSKILETSEDADFCDTLPNELEIKTDDIAVTDNEMQHTIILETSEDADFCDILAGGSKLNTNVDEMQQTTILGTSIGTDFCDTLPEELEIKTDEIAVTDNEMQHTIILETSEDADFCDTLPGGSKLNTNVDEMQQTTILGTSIGTDFCDTLPDELEIKTDEIAVTDNEMQHTIILEASEDADFCDTLPGGSKLNTNVDEMQQTTILGTSIGTDFCDTLPDELEIKTDEIAVTDNEMQHTIILETSENADFCDTLPGGSKLNTNVDEMQQTTILGTSICTDFCDTLPNELEINTDDIAVTDNEMQHTIILDTSEDADFCDTLPDGSKLNTNVDEMQQTTILGTSIGTDFCDTLPDELKIKTDDIVVIDNEMQHTIILDTSEDADFCDTLPDGSKLNTNVDEMQQTTILGTSIGTDFCDTSPDELEIKTDDIVVIDNEMQHTIILETSEDEDFCDILAGGSKLNTNVDEMQQTTILGTSIGTDFCDTLPDELEIKTDDIAVTDNEMQHTIILKTSEDADFCDTLPGGSKLNTNVDEMQQTTILGTSIDFSDTLPDKSQINTDGIAITHDEMQHTIILETSEDADFCDTLPYGSKLNTDVDEIEQTAILDTFVVTDFCVILPNESEINADDIAGTDAKIQHTIILETSESTGFCDMLSGGSQLNTDSATEVVTVTDDEIKILETFEYTNSCDIFPDDIQLTIDPIIITYDQMEQNIIPETSIETEIYDTLPDGSNLNTDTVTVTDDEIQTGGEGCAMEDITKLGSEKSIVEIETKDEDVNGNGIEIQKMLKTFVDKDFCDALPYETKLITGNITIPDDCRMKDITRLGSERCTVDIEINDEADNGNDDIEMQQTKILVTSVDKDFCDTLPYETKLITDVIRITDDEIQTAGEDCTMKDITILGSERCTVDIENNDEADNGNDDIKMQQNKILETSVDKDFCDTLPYETKLITDVIRITDDEIQTAGEDCTMKDITILGSERCTVDIENNDEADNGNDDIEMQQTKILETSVDKDFCDTLPYETKLITDVIRITDDEIQTAGEDCTMKDITILGSERCTVDIENNDEADNGNDDIEMQQTKILETSVDKDFCDTLPYETKLITDVIRITDDEIQTAGEDCTMKYITRLGSERCTITIENNEEYIDRIDNIELDQRVITMTSVPLYFHTQLEEIQFKANIVGCSEIDKIVHKIKIVNDMDMEHSILNEEHRSMNIMDKGVTENTNLDIESKQEFETSTSCNMRMLHNVTQNIISNKGDVQNYIDQADNVNVIETNLLVENNSVQLQSDFPIECSYTEFVKGIHSVVDSDDGLSSSIEFVVKDDLIENELFKKVLLELNQKKNSVNQNLHNLNSDINEIHLPLLHFSDAYDSIVGNINANEFDTVTHVLNNTEIDSVFSISECQNNLNSEHHENGYTYNLQNDSDYSPDSIYNESIESHGVKKTYKSTEALCFPEMNDSSSDDTDISCKLTETEDSENQRVSFKSSLALYVGSDFEEGNSAAAQQIFDIEREPILAEAELLLTPSTSPNHFESFDKNLSSYVSGMEGYKNRILDTSSSSSSSSDIKEDNYFKDSTSFSLKNKLPLKFQNIFSNLDNTADNMFKRIDSQVMNEGEVDCDIRMPSFYVFENAKSKMKIKKCHCSASFKKQLTKQIRNRKKIVKSDQKVTSNNMFLESIPSNMSSIKPQCSKFVMKRKNISKLKQKQNSSIRSNIASTSSDEFYSAPISCVSSSESFFVSLDDSDNASCCQLESTVERRETDPDFKIHSNKFENCETVMRALYDNNNSTELNKSDVVSEGNSGYDADYEFTTYFKGNFSNINLEDITLNMDMSDTDSIKSFPNSIKKCNLRNKSLSSNKLNKQESDKLEVIDSMKIDEKKRSGVFSMSRENLNEISYISEPSIDDYIEISRSSISAVEFLISSDEDERCFSKTDKCRLKLANTYESAVYSPSSIYAGSPQLSTIEEEDSFQFPIHYTNSCSTPLPTSP